MKTNEKTVTVFRFNPMTIYKGGGYPLFSVEITDWNTNILEAKKAFDSFGVKSISKDEMDDFIFSTDNTFILGEIQAATILESEYKEYLKDTSNIEIIGYACNYDFKIIEEKSFMATGKKVPKKMLQSMY